MGKGANILQVAIPVKGKLRNYRGCLVQFGCGEMQSRTAATKMILSSVQNFLETRCLDKHLRDTANIASDDTVRLTRSMERCFDSGRLWQI